MDTKDMSAKERFFSDGTFLFQEGDPSRSMFLIVSGRVSIVKKKGSGHVELARIYPKEVIGELSFFDRQPRSAAAVASGDVIALEIDFQSLDSVYKNIPDYMKTIMSCVAERLRKADETIRKLKTVD